MTICGETFDKLYVWGNSRVLLFSLGASLLSSRDFL